MAINFTNIEEYLIERIREVNPNANVAPGGAIRDLLVSPLIPLLQPLANEIQKIKKNQSLLNAENMSDEDIDAILANIFVSRKTGGKASGDVTVILRSALPTTVTAGSIFVSGTGLQFYSKATVFASSSSLVPNPSTGRYEMTVAVEAKEPGQEYNIPKNSITGIISTNPNIIGAKNEEGFSGGTDSEDNSTLIARATTSVGSRTLATQRGAEHILTEAFTSIQKVNVIGFGDEDMIRDKVYAPEITIDGITYPESEGVHLGGKIDIYVLTGIDDREMHIANTGTGGEVGSGDNVIGLYSDSESGIQYEGTVDGDGVLCDTSTKPIVDIIGVNMDEVTLENPSYAAVSFLEDRDFVFTSKSPGKSNSVDEEKKILFVRGAGTASNVVHNSSYVNTSGQYYSFDYVVNSEFMSFQDMREGKNLFIIGLSQQEVTEVGLVNTEDSRDGGGALDLSPDRGLVSITNSLGQNQAIRSVHITTGRDGEAVRSITQPTSGAYSFTICGWYNLRSLPPEPAENAAIPKRTLFNMHGSTLHEQGISFNEATREDIIHAYVDESGRIHFNTKSVNSPVVEHVSAAAQGGSSVITADGQTGVDNWVFLAFTYNSILQRKEFFFGGKANTDIQYGIWEGSPFNPGISQIDYDDFGSQLTIGSVDTGEYEIYLSENKPEFSGTSVVQVWDGLIDGLQIYDHVLSYTQLNEIYKNSNTATIQGVEETTIPEALKPLWDGDVGNGSHPFMFGGVIYMLSGNAEGSEFTIVSNTQPFDPNTDLSITVRSNGGAPVSRIQAGDKYCLLPRVMEFQQGGTAQITNIAGQIVPIGGGLNVGEEVNIGVGIDLSYYSGDSITDIQEYVDLEESRPANVDFLVKHCFPVFVSGSIRYKTSSIISEDEILASVKQYISSLGVGVDFVVSEFINYLFGIGLNYVELPIDLTFNYRNVRFQKEEQKNIEDTFVSGKNQYFVPDAITVESIN